MINFVGAARARVCVALVRLDGRGMFAIYRPCVRFIVYETDSLCVGLFSRKFATFSFIYIRTEFLVLRTLDRSLALRLKETLCVSSLTNRV